jgi:acetylornithine deacetylase
MTPSSLLADLVRIPSVSGNEEAVVAFVFGVLRDAGLPAVQMGRNVCVTIGSPGARHLLFHSHLDTVPPAANWPGDPYAADWVDGKLVGIGANDAKGCVAAMMWAVRELAALDLPGQVTLALTVEEETGGKDGIQAFLSSFRGGGEGVLTHLTAAIFGEPTSLRACIAQRGLLLLRITAEGTAAHVAHGKPETNAIHRAARDIARLEALTWEPHPILGAMQAQVTQIQGGTARNQIPAACEYFVDFRTTPNYSHELITDCVRQTLESNLIVHSERYHPRDTDRGESIVQAALKHASQSEPVGSHTVSDWAFCDLPAVKIGPGDTHRSHTAGEYLLLEELEAGIDFYRECTLTYLREGDNALG